MLHTVDLVTRRAADLTHRLGDAVHPVNVGLAQQTAAGVDRQAAAESEVLDGGEVLRFAAWTKAELLELHQHEWGEVIVEKRGLDVGGREPRLAPQLLR